MEQILSSYTKSCGFSDFRRGVCQIFTVLWVTQSRLRVVVIYGRFETIRGQAVWDCLTFKMGPMGFSKTSVISTNLCFVTSLKNKDLKRLVAQFVTEFVSFYEAEVILSNNQTKKFIPCFHKIILILSSHLCLFFPSCPFTLDILAKILLYCLCVWCFSQFRNSVKLSMLD